MTNARQQVAATEQVALNIDGNLGRQREQLIAAQGNVRLCHNMQHRYLYMMMMIICFTRWLKHVLQLKKRVDIFPV